MAVLSIFMRDGLEPPRIVVHYDDGSWSFTCGTAREVEHFTLWHAEHVFHHFGHDLFHLGDLPRGYIAERDERDDEWSVKPYDGD